MNEINETQARDLAERYLEQLFSDSGTSVVVTGVQEVDIGWVFFYQSEEYQQSGDDRDFLYGNAPLVVDREGHVHRTGTSLPLDDYLDRIRDEVQGEVIDG
ncbi:MAG TPA: YrhB domain-containing protein [Candidatus Dormibacteraeota bacterium]|jgi:hypothetical protein|nr:YrhB domain-containing protein [Candidatus Dormibacteraeota bacterium]